jgi:type IV pilus biogenesis/stability protein PilW
MTVSSHFRLCAVLILILTAACASTQDPQREKKAEAARNLGEAYLREGNFTLALKELLKAESINPNDPYLHNDIGLAYYGKRKFDKAIRHYKTALDLKSDYAPAMNNLGNAYMAQKRWDSAIEYYEQAIDSSLYATPHFPLSNLGAVYYEKGDYRRSEQYYLEALELEPNFVQALRGIARTYMAVGRVEDAIFKLEKAVRINPDAAVLFYELGTAYLSAGHGRDARAAYNEVIQLAPESAVADQARMALRKLN